jgi:signal transduction histidine kinase
MPNSVIPYFCKDSLFAPLMLAAYAVWLAVLIGLLNDHDATSFLAESPSHWLALLLHGAFLLVFIVNEWTPPRSLLERLLVGLLALLVLAVCLLQRNSVLPALSVIVVPQFIEHFSRRVGLWLMLLFNVALWLIMQELWHIELAVIWVLSFVGFQTFAIVMRRTNVQSELQRQHLVAVNAELIATRQLLEVSTRDQERLRLSRELHDVAGHKLTALKLQLATLQATEPNQGTLQLCGELTTELLDDIRGVVAHLRSADVPDLQTLLEQQIRAFPKPQVTLQLAPLHKPVNTSTAQVLLRAVQEALTNAARHSTATQMWITVHQQNDQLLLSIEDNGRAPAQPVLGNGLSGMQERFAALGGSLRIARTASLGFGLYGTLPP